MDYVLYDAYEAICQELGWAPSAPAQFWDAMRLSPERAHVRRLGDTWVLLRDDLRDGCGECLGSISEFIEYFYSGDEDPVFTDESAEALIGAIHGLHDLSIAVTNAYGAQNWSCVVPASDCGGCTGRRQGVVPSALRSTVPEMMETAVTRTDTGGERAMSAEAFVARNRWAFGFASIVGNPVLVPDIESVSLVNAPIRTSTDVLRCEIAGGKGISIDQALASCLGEAFERYSLASVDRSGVVVGTSDGVDRAIDAVKVFGFPVRDEHPSIVPLGDDTVLEWIDATDLHSGRVIRVPANFAFCPYVSGSYATIVAGSTNGAASGATREDARVQALREIVERDAFWYYARTGAEPIHVDLSTLPPDLVSAVRSFDGNFTVSLLPNPFGAPVANVTFIPNSGFQTKAARGSGHSPTVEESVRRAFAECIQMLYSLDSAIDVESVPTDMRNLWFTGEARRALPNFFADSAALHTFERARVGFIENQPAERLVESAAEQRLGVFEIALVNEPGFAVSKVVLSGASVCDATYFETCNRLADFASSLNHPERRLQYRGSLFM